jgi:eukaryotic-like serine/threonine-protein kinase
MSDRSRHVRLTLAQSTIGANAKSDGVRHSGNHLGGHCLESGQVVRNRVDRTKPCPLCRTTSDTLLHTVQPQFQPATTTASRVKCLFLHIDKHHGRARADAFLVSAKLDRGYLDDETRPIPVEAWFRALLSFTSHWGRAELEKVASSHVHADNLGVWARVLRGADNPMGAFRQLGQLGGEEVLTERWDTLELGQRHWVGHVLVRADQAEERDGLCSLARASELSSIPMLFGLPRARVRSETLSSSRPDTLEQRYHVTWGSSATYMHCLLAGLGLVIGCSVGLLQQAAWLTVAFEASLGSFVGFVLGVLHGQWRARTLTNAAQVVRLRALERSVGLRETREQRQSGLLEGGVVAGQYRLGNKLGVGASGAIWEATRLSDGRVVAIKLLRAAVAHDSVAADRLRREAAALGLAWHPNVVEVYDDGHLPDGTSYLVMERLYGESLSERLRRVGTIEPGQLLPLALQVCDALGAVHAAGIVHRDLKPSNIFLARISSSEASGAPVAAGIERAKLLDFGIARVEWAETRLTNAGAPLGTPGYMSPEQEQGLEIDARSDLFALGSILFECLTGSPPPMTSAEFRSEPRGQLVDSAVQLAFREIPERWRAVVERATDPLPRHRYPDARTMKDALQDLAESSGDQTDTADVPGS